MRSLIAILFLAACSSSSSPDPGTTEPDFAERTTDAGEALDSSTTQSDGAIAQVDLSQPAAADLAHPPADLEVACGQNDGPCCNTAVCTSSSLPAGSFCPAPASCSGGMYRACRMAPTPTCLACGGSGQWCCPGATPCIGGGACAGPSSAIAGHCG